MIGGQQLPQNKIQETKISSTSFPQNPVQSQSSTVDPYKQPQCHIYTYESPWRCYAVGYSWRPDQSYRFGIASLLEEGSNNVFLNYNDRSK